MRFLLFFILMLTSVHAWSGTALTIEKSSNLTLTITSPDELLVYHTETSPPMPWKYPGAYLGHNIPSGDIILNFHSTTGASSKLNINTSILEDLVVYFKGEEPVQHFVAFPHTTGGTVYLRDPANMDVLHQFDMTENRWTLEPYLLESFPGKYVLLDVAGGKVNIGATSQQRTQAQHTFALVEKASLYSGSTTVSLPTHIAYLSLRDEMPSLLPEELDELYQNNLRKMVAAGFNYTGNKDYEALYLRQKGVPVSELDFSLTPEEALVDQYLNGTHSLFSTLFSFEPDEQEAVFALRFSELSGWMKLDRTHLKSRQYTIDVIGKGTVKSPFLTLIEEDGDSPLLRRYTTTIGNKHQTNFALYAYPAEGYEFAEWIGCNSSRDTICYPDMEDNIGVVFRPKGANVLTPLDGAVFLSEFTSERLASGHLRLKVFGDQDKATEQSLLLQPDVLIKTTGGDYYTVDSIIEATLSDAIIIAATLAPIHTTLAKGYASSLSATTNIDIWDELMPGIPYVPNIAVFIEEKNSYFVTSNKADSQNLVYAQEVVSFTTADSAHEQSMQNTPSENEKTLGGLDCEGNKYSIETAAKIGGELAFQGERSVCNVQTEKHKTEERTLMDGDGLRVTTQRTTVGGHAIHGTSTSGDMSFPWATKFGPITIVPYGSVKSDIAMEIRGGYTIDIRRYYFIRDGQEKMIEDKSFAKVSPSELQPRLLSISDDAMETKESIEFGIKAITPENPILSVEGKLGAVASIITETPSVNHSKNIVNPECLQIKTLKGHGVIGIKGTSGPLSISTEKDFLPYSFPLNGQKCLELNIAAEGQDVTLGDGAASQTFSYKITNKSEFNVKVSSRMDTLEGGGGFSFKQLPVIVRPGNSITLPVSFSAESFKNTGFESHTAQFAISAEPVSGYGNIQRFNKTFKLSAQRKIARGVFVRLGHRKSEIAPGRFLVRPELPPYSSCVYIMCPEIYEKPDAWRFSVLVRKNNPDASFSYEHHNDVPMSGVVLDYAGAHAYGQNHFWVITQPASQPGMPSNESIMKPYTGQMIDVNSQRFLPSLKGTSTCTDRLGQKTATTISTQSGRFLFPSAFTQLEQRDLGATYMKMYSKLTKTTTNIPMHGTYSYNEPNSSGHNCEIQFTLFLTDLRP